MTLGVTGATGFVGRALIDYALRRGHEVIAFTRRPEVAIPGCAVRRFRADSSLDVTGCQAIVHLAGEPIAGLWTAAKKRRIMESRVEGTRHLVEAINAAESKPEVLVCASAIGFYGHTGQSAVTEKDGAGKGFLARTVAAWEAEAGRVQGVRLVLLRSAMVLGKGGGAMALMAPLFRAGLGGPLGDGQRWMSWIHLEDEVRMILFAVENLDAQGALNAAAPWPVRNSEFTRVLAEVVQRPAFLRVPEALLRLCGEMPAELLASCRVLPEAALDLGYGFQYSELGPALRNLMGR